jgi:hypothetical protein
MADGDERVLELARAIRPYLPELVGDKAGAMDHDLARLLEVASRTTTAPADILDSLGAHAATQEWGAKFLETGLPPDVASLFEVRRGDSYEDLAGLGGAVRARKYVCPNGDFVWYHRYQGQVPPLCPTHGCDLVPVMASRK